MSGVDVAAIREALAKASESPGAIERYGHMGAIEMLLEGGFSWNDAKLIVLLRNNAEALLDAAATAYDEGETSAWNRHRPEWERKSNPYRVNSSENGAGQ